MIKLGHMIRKALTYFTILALTALPVQLISASADTVSMQMSMSQTMVTSSECENEMTTQAANSCCDDPSSGCQGCNDVPSATSVMVSASQAPAKIALLKRAKMSIHHLVLDGVPQKNLLRPPRTLI